MINTKCPSCFYYLRLFDRETAMFECSNKQCDLVLQIPSLARPRPRFDDDVPTPQTNLEGFQ